MRKIFFIFLLDSRLPPLFEKIQTGVLFFRAGGVKFQSPEYLF